jgi:hypothetical protein
LKPEERLSLLRLKPPALSHFALMMSLGPERPAEVLRIGSSDSLMLAM